VEMKTPSELGCRATTAQAKGLAAQILREVSQWQGASTGPEWAQVFELLSAVPVFPASTQDATQGALGPANPTAAGGRACITVHLDGTASASVDCCAAFLAIHRTKLSWQWLGVPSGPASLEQAGGLEPNWLSFSQEQGMALLIVPNRTKAAPLPARWATRCVGHFVCGIEVEFDKDRISSTRLHVLGATLLVN
jgi:hypothetical protein